MPYTREEINLEAGVMVGINLEIETASTVAKAIAMGFAQHLAKSAKNVDNMLF